jgi:uncharacterized protein YcnI
MNKTPLVISVLAAALSIASPAFCHVTLEQREATIGSPTKLTFRVPHGCEDQPTVTVRVLIPEGFIAAKPMPKAGWTLEVSQGDYAKSHDYFHNVKLSKGTKEISWKGNLPGEYYDEFIVSGFVSRDFKPDAMLYFPVVQECPSGAHRWIEVPAAGQSGSDLKEPAPGIKLLPKK